jgi:CRP-like cAMP-binding protein
MFNRPTGYDEYLNGLGDLTLFAGLRRRELGRIGTLTTYLRLPAGSELCGQGTVAMDAFIILSGSVALSAGGAVFAHLDRGDALGVRELRNWSRRPMTATAEGTVEVLVLSRPELTTLLAQHPAVADRLLGPAAEPQPAAHRRVTVAG